jgi:hypothetical protein
MRFGLPPLFFNAENKKKNKRDIKKLLDCNITILSSSTNNKNHYKILLPRFDKRIEIIDGSSGSSCNGSFKVKTTTKNKNDHRAAHESKSFSVTERDLLIPMPF